MLALLEMVGGRKVSGHGRDQALNLLCKNVPRKDKKDTDHSRTLFTIDHGEPCSFTDQAYTECNWVNLLHFVRWLSRQQSNDTVSVQCTKRVQNTIEIGNLKMCVCLRSEEDPQGVWPDPGPSRPAADDGKHPADSQRAPQQAVRQIGRASCRERV